MEYKNYLELDDFSFRFKHFYESAQENVCVVGLVRKLYYEYNLQTENTLL